MRALATGRSSRRKRLVAQRIGDNTWMINSKYDGPLNMNSEGLQLACFHFRGRKVNVNEAKHEEEDCCSHQTAVQYRGMFCKACGCFARNVYWLFDNKQVTGESISELRGFQVSWRGPHTTLPISISAPVNNAQLKLLWIQRPMMAEVLAISSGT